METILNNIDKIQTENYLYKNYLNKRTVFPKLNNINTSQKAFQT